MCLDPASLGMMALSTGMATGGKLLGQNEALNAARRTAAGRNDVLQGQLGKIDAFGAGNRQLFNERAATFAPAAQQGQLTGAQNTRADAVNNTVSQVDPSSVPLADNAPAAAKGEIAKRMLAAFQQSTSNAKAAGALGGYGDTSLANKIGIADTGRNVGVNNNFAQGENSLIDPLQQLSDVKAYRPPNPLIALLGGGGNLLGAATGGGMFRPGATPIASSVSFEAPGMPMNINPFG